MREFLKWAAIIAVAALVICIQYKVAVSALPDWVKYLILK